MEQLSKSDLTCLRWAKRLNANGCGFLGPTVKKAHGPLTAYVALEARGLVRCNTQSRVSQPADELGYWITPLGLAALKEPA